MSKESEEIDLEEIEARREAAHQMVSDLCHRKREWIMSIPARRDYDPDLIIAASLDDIPKMIEELEELYLIESTLQAMFNWWDDRECKERDTLVSLLEKRGWVRR